MHAELRSLVDGSMHKIAGTLCFVSLNYFAISPFVGFSEICFRSPRCPLSSFLFSFFYTERA